MSRATFKSADEMTAVNVALVCAAAIIIVALVTGRPLSLRYKDTFRADIKTIKETVGQTNGDGTIAKMSERMLAESAETKNELTEIRQTLMDRTHVLRQGATEPEDLAAYTQARMHDVLSAIARLQMMVEVMWSRMRSDYDLPELSSDRDPESPPKEG